MTDQELVTDVYDLLQLYGPSIPPLPRPPQTASWTVRWGADLGKYAQQAANDQRYRYHGDLSALIRHAVNLLLLALSKSSHQDVSHARFEMELLRERAEQESYTAFVDYAQGKIKEAEEYAGTMTGRKRVGALLLAITATISTQPSETSRRRMQAYLTSHGKFVKMVRELGDEWLKSWLELAT